MARHTETTSETTLIHIDHAPSLCVYLCVPVCLYACLSVIPSPLLRLQNKSHIVAPDRTNARPTFFTPPSILIHSGSAFVPLLSLSPSNPAVCRLSNLGVSNHIPDAWCLLAARDVQTRQDRQARLSIQRTRSGQGQGQGKTQNQARSSKVKVKSKVKDMVFTKVSCRAKKNRLRADSSCGSADRDNRLEYHIAV